MDVFASNCIEAFDIESGAPTEVTGRTNVTYSTKGILTNGGSLKSRQFINPTTGATLSLTSGWFHACYYASDGNHSILELLDSAGTAVMRIFAPAQNSFRADYWNGSAWITTAATFAGGANAEYTLDLQFTCGAGGTMNFYVNNNLIAAITGLTASVDNVAFVRLTGNNFIAYQFLISDASTIGAFVASLTPNSNSATNTAWANDYTNIAKTGINDATFISSATLADSETYGATDVTLPTAGYSVSSLWFAIRGRLNAGSPGNIKPMLRMGGVNYVGAYNFGGGLNTSGFNQALAAFANDPSTGAAWSGVTNLNAAELGVQTAA